MMFSFLLDSALRRKRPANTWLGGNADLMACRAGIGGDRAASCFVSS
jgi:hypothetical protein